TDNAELSESCETEEEHEELPYDGAHTSPCETVTEMPSHNFSTLDKLSMPFVNAEQTEACQSNLTHGLLCNHKAIKDVALPVATPIQPADHINDFLLRHFSKEELLNSSRIIEAETLPEMSLMDSIDETVRSRASQAAQIFVGEREKIQDVMEEPDPSIAESHRLTELNVSNESSSSKGPGSTSDAQKPKCSFSRTRSYSDLKYGQGKVHYPLPDFSKVAPKVKMPKGNASVKPISQSPAMARAQSSPGILGKSASSCKPTADIISRVLEDSIKPPKNVFTDKEVAHQLQVNLYFYVIL
uniref:Uncharacterized protein n=1 Tax=Sinocyclocheilus anshuiensis TaxID=1608454 RepID=A0A671LZA4_9TELE